MITMVEKEQKEPKDMTLIEIVNKLFEIDDAYRASLAHLRPLEDDPEYQHSEIAKAKAKYAPEYARYKNELKNFGRSKPLPDFDDVSDKVG